MIWHVVNRVKQTNLVNQIALVTTKLDEDKKLLDIELYRKQKENHEKQKTKNASSCKSIDTD